MGRNWSNGAVVGVSVTAGIVIACVIGGVGTGISNALQPPYPIYSPYPVYTPEPYDFTPPPGDFTDLETGPAGSPAPVSPMACAGACFDESSAELAILDDDVFAGFGFASYKHVWKMTGDRTTAHLLQPVEHEGWAASGFAPGPCFVTWSDSPFVETEDAAVGDDFIAPLTEHSADGNYLSRVLQSVRLFPDAAAAESYMSTLATGLASCTRYENDQGYGFDVTTEPALDVPASVGSAGFVKSPEPGMRYYVFDLQRGNMVIRTVVVNAGVITDAAFRELVRLQAERLETLAPVA